MFVCVGSPSWPHKNIHKVPDRPWFLHFAVFTNKPVDKVPSGMSNNQQLRQAAANSPRSLASVSLGRTFIGTVQRRSYLAPPPTANGTGNKWDVSD